MREEGTVGKENKYSYLGLLVVALTFSIPATYSNIAIGLLVLFWIIEGDYHLKLKRIRQNKFLWFVIGFFGLYLVSITYTENFKEGLYILEKKATLILLPLILASIKISPKQTRSILSSFVIGNFAVSLILLSRVVFHFFSSKDCSVCFYHQFTAFVDLHAIYYSLFILTSIYILLNDYRHIHKVFFTFAIGVFTICLIFAASKTLLFSFIILLPVFLLFHFQKKEIELRKRVIVGVLSFFIIIILSIFFLKPVRERFYNSLDSSSLQYTEIIGTDDKLNNTQKSELTGFTLRVLLAGLALDKIFQDEAFVFGYGPADVPGKLNEIYLKHNMAPNWFYGYNTHNQYVQIFLELGLPGLLYLLSLLVVGFYYSIKYKNLVLTFLIVLMSIGFLTEVFLNRNKGVVFFAFFYALFLLNSSNKRIAE